MYNSSFYKRTSRYVDCLSFWAKIEDVFTVNGQMSAERLMDWPEVRNKQGQAEKTDGRTDGQTHRPQDGRTADTQTDRNLSVRDNCR